MKKIISDNNLIPPCPGCSIVIAVVAELLFLLFLLSGRS